MVYTSDITLKLICLEDPFTAFSSQPFDLCGKLKTDACFFMRIEEWGQILWVAWSSLSLQEP